MKTFLSENLLDVIKDFFLGDEESLDSKETKDISEELTDADSKETKESSEELTDADSKETKDISATESQGNQGLKLSGDFVNMYDGKALDSDGNIWNLTTGENEGLSGGIALTDTKTLNTSSYGGRILKTYGSFTESIEGGSKDMLSDLVFAKNGHLFAIDASSESESSGMDVGSILADYYQGSQYLSVLGDDGSIHDLAYNLETPEDFRNMGINELAGNLNASNHIAIGRYRNGTAFAFNYMTGERIPLLEEKSEVLGKSETLLDFARDYLDAHVGSWLGITNSDYQGALEKLSTYKDSEILDILGLNQDKNTPTEAEKTDASGENEGVSAGNNGTADTSGNSFENGEDSISGEALQSESDETENISTDSEDSSEESLNEDSTEGSSANESSYNESSEKESSDEESSDKETSDKESSDKESSDKESSDKESSVNSSDDNASENEASAIEDISSEDAGTEDISSEEKSDSEEKSSSDDKDSTENGTKEDESSDDTELSDEDESDEDESDDEYSEDESDDEFSDDESDEYSEDESEGQSPKADDSSENENSSGTDTLAALTGTDSSNTSSGNGTAAGDGTASSNGLASGNGEAISDGNGLSSGDNGALESVVSSGEAGLSDKDSLEEALKAENSISGESSGNTDGKDQFITILDKETGEYKTYTVDDYLSGSRDRIMTVDEKLSYLAKTSYADKDKASSNSSINFQGAGSIFGSAGMIFALLIILWNKLKRLHRA